MLKWTFTILAYSIPKEELAVLCAAERSPNQAAVSYELIA